MDTSSPATLLDLPDALLVQCLGLLPMRNRLEAVCLVCKRLRQLCLAPELLRSIQLGEEGPVALPRCRELLCFLAQHAQHVQRLTLHLQLSTGSGDTAAAEPAVQQLHDQAQLAAAVIGCVAACAAASGGGSTGLEELALSGATPATQIGQWLPHLARLQVLWIGQEREALVLPAALSHLTALRELGVRGARVLSDPGELRLPLSLTRLSVTGNLGRELLGSQLARLTNLQSLETARCGPDCGTAMAGITALSSLHTLHLDVCQPLLPGWLPTLTQLRQLVVSGDLFENDGGEDPAFIAAEASQQLEPALAPLHQLTCLALLVLPVTRVPPAVAHLPLQRLIVDTYFWPDQPSAGLLVPCTMLTSLRWLGLDWQVAQSSLEALASASQLEHFGLTSLPDSLDAPGQQALWQQWCNWAATHPPLRCLSLEPGQSTSNRGTLHAHVNSIVALARCRPQLCIRSTMPPPANLTWCRSSEPDTRSFFFFAEELLSCPDIPN